MARTLLPREPSQGQVLAKFMGTRVTAPCRGTGPQAAAGLNPAQLHSKQAFTLSCGKHHHHFHIHNFKVTSQQTLEPFK